MPTICCANCLIVIPDAAPQQRFCPECAAERERIRKLKWTFKRMATAARAKRCRPKKVAA
jgi:hypothetical protein